MKNVIKKWTIFLSLLAILLVFPVLTFAGNEPFHGFNHYVNRVLAKWDVPGIAVAIVRDGKLVFAKGYGVRKKGSSAPVTPRTIFGIASNTKAFTAAALAILVDEGKIRWDDPVIKYLPYFRMYDPYVTRTITIRDLLTHRSGLGLGAGDLLFWPQSTYTRKEIIRRLQFIKPRFSFRSRFAYCNICYVVAGEIIPAVTGKSWADFVEERIFKPLEMDCSKTSIKEFRPGNEIAYPHTKIGNKVVPVEYENLDNVGPAGSINSNVIDMAKWVAVQLNHGLIKKTPEGELRLFSERESQQMWSPQIYIPIRKYPPELSSLKPNFFAYGLGWMLRDYHGHKMVYHTGSIKGMVSRVTLIPDMKLGIIVLTNQEVREAYEAITYRILDHYLGLSPTDWVEKFEQARERRMHRIRELVKHQSLKRVKGTKPSLKLAQYAGKYKDKWYGEMYIDYNRGKLIMRFGHTPALVGSLEHWHYDTFVVRWYDRSLNADAFVTFYINYRGEIEAVKMRPVSPLTDFSFDFQDLLFVPAKE